MKQEVDEMNLSKLEKAKRAGGGKSPLPQDFTADLNLFLGHQIALEMKKEDFSMLHGKSSVRNEWFEKKMHGWFDSHGIFSE